MSQNNTPKRCSGNKPYKRPITLTVSEEQVAFRLLCTTTAAGGVIGHSGTIVKRLERETSARIHVEDTVSAASKERLIIVVGSFSVDRNLRFDGEDESADVSAAQEGLVRVFERVLEVEPPVEGGLVRCRLLVGQGMVGAVIGGGRKKINKITKETGAYIWIFSQESLPPCADLNDGLVQITGGSLAVRKALVAVSKYLQQKASQLVRANGSTSAVVSNPSIDMEMNCVNISSTVKGEVATEVVFRLLCPCDAAGAVIGWKGRKVKFIEEETGASVRFSVPEAGCRERIITVSAYESRESAYSSAQNALLRVFKESTSSDGRTPVSATARLLILPKLPGWLNARRALNISHIQKATGAKLQILEDNHASFDGSTSEKIMQIDGEYSSVLIALSQVSWRLRENIIGKDNALLLPHERFNLRPYVEETNTMTDRVNKHKIPFSQCLEGQHLPTITGNSRDLTTDTDGFVFGRGNKSVMVTNTKVEIVVCNDLFGSVYGDDGSNLARLRMISGATVEVQDPCPESDGKVIISGTPDQTLAAQSLLQAFIMAAR